MVWTNIGKQKMFEAWFEASTAPSYFTLMLSTSSASFTADLSSTGQISSVLVSSGTGGGNGYAPSGLRVNRNGVDLSVSTNLASDYVDATLGAGFLWSATGGQSISGIDFVILATDEADIYTRSVLGYWLVGGNPLTITDGNTLTITRAVLRGS